MNFRKGQLTLIFDDLEVKRCAHSQSNSLPICIIYLHTLSRSISDHHLRCGVGAKSGWVIKTIYKKLNRGILKRIQLNPRSK